MYMILYYFAFDQVQNECQISHSFMAQFSPNSINDYDDYYEEEYSFENLLKDYKREIVNIMKFSNKKLANFFTNVHIQVSEKYKHLSKKCETIHDKIGLLYLLEFNKQFPNLYKSINITSNISSIVDQINDKINKLYEEIDDDEYDELEQKAKNINIIYKSLNTELKINCTLCYELFRDSPKKLTCCDKLLCSECHHNLYSKTYKKGEKIIFTNHHCPFCRTYVKSSEERIHKLFTDGEYDESKNYFLAENCDCLVSRKQTCDNNISDIAPSCITHDDIGNLLTDCPSCGVRIIREFGCDHMTCSCGIEFCFKCKKQINMSIFGPNIHIFKCETSPHE